MSSLITSLKSEITRVARKELKGELQTLRKTTTAHRSEIASLKRQVKSMGADIKALRRTAKALGAEAPTSEETVARPSRFRFSAERFAALRAKLGLTQVELAKLLNASSLSVHKWEAGTAHPRAAQVDKIASAMKLGKRQARAILDAM